MNNRMDGQNPMLLDKLTDYAGTDHYPFHMPGHKRREELGITSFPNPFSVDITEIDGFDNLHHAEGMLKDSMERAASRSDLLYGEWKYRGYPERCLRADASGREDYHGKKQP